MNQELPKGWDEERIRKIIEHYENQTEEEALAEDEAARSREGYAWVQIPHALLPEIMQLIDEYEDKAEAKESKRTGRRSLRK